MPLPAVSRQARSTALRDAATICAGLVLLAAWEIGGLDLPLARLYGSAQGFVWRDHWLTGGVLHGGARALAWALFGVLVLGLWRPLAFVRGLLRRERVWWLATTLLCVSLIPLLKRTSATSCPWSLVEFGAGLAEYVPHWMPGVRDGGPGGCFPSGHASTAFAFLTGWFALRERAPVAARRWLIATVAVGLGLGWVQMMRGAHYLSHSLWTAWICWTVAALSFHLVQSWRSAARPAASSLETANDKLA
ncbi:MAG: phosphatase PAP2 family protein [Rubrivivax sp.]|nr:phosphatase PAP2 family protein [Rubrivivax sp.]